MTHIENSIALDVGVVVVDRAAVQGCRVLRDSDLERCDAKRKQERKPRCSIRRPEIVPEYSAVVQID